MGITNIDMSSKVADPKNYFPDYGCGLVWGPVVATGITGIRLGFEWVIFSWHKFFESEVKREITTLNAPDLNVIPILDYPFPPTLSHFWKFDLWPLPSFNDMSIFVIPVPVSLLPTSFSHFKIFSLHSSFPLTPWSYSWSPHSITPPLKFSG